jgi:predicted nucleotidyltransferase
MAYSRAHIEENTILLCVAGSRMYNLHTPSSDWDYRGVMTRPISTYAGWSQFEQKNEGWEKESSIGGVFSRLGGDTTIYDLRKFLTLLREGRPNQIEYLFAKDYLHLTEAGKYLISQRDKFLTNQIKFRFIGYAKSQIQRMETHRKWLLDPPSKPPEKSEFGSDVMSRDEVNALCELLWVSVKDRLEYLRPVEKLATLLNGKIDYKAIFKNYPIEDELIKPASIILNTNESAITRLQRSQRYYAELRKWQNYQHWLKKRNPERAKIEAKVGYDTKHALHCLRLLFQAHFLFRDQFLYVDLTEVDPFMKEMLVGIKQGKISYEEVRKASDFWFNVLSEEDTNKLPNPISYQELETILFETISKHELQKKRILPS